MWKLKQQAGRVGRNGSPALEIVILFPQKGNSFINTCASKSVICQILGRAAPEASVRNVMKGDLCIRKGVNDMFKIENPLGKHKKKIQKARIHKKIQNSGP